MTMREQDGEDIWDRIKRKMAPPMVQAAGAPPQQQAADIPPWAQDTALRMPQTRGGQYETGDPQRDAFLRKRATEDMGGGEDAYGEGYQNPEEFKRLMRGAYTAGKNGDTGALDSFPPNTPIGQLMRRAYNDGQRARGQRR